MGKNYIENSLKRFLKRKVKITMGFVVAFMIMGTGVFAEELFVSGGDPQEIKGTDLEYTSEHKNSLEGKPSRFAGLGVVNGGNVNITSNSLTVNNKNIDNKEERLYGVFTHGNGSELKYTGKKFTINVENNSKQTHIRGLRNQANGIQDINASIIEINVNNMSENNQYVAGIDSWDGAKTTFNGEILKVIVKSNSNGDLSWADGIQCGNNGNITVNSKNTIIDVYNKGYTGEGVISNVGSNMVFNGNTDIKVTSSYGANGIIGNGNLTFTNGIVNIHTIIDKGVGYSNNVGIIGDDTVNITNGVEQLNITVEGSGLVVEQGTAGIYTNGLTDKISIDSKELNINVIAGKTTDNSIFDEKTLTEHQKNKYSNSYGIRNTNGTINIGEKTTTNITVEEGYKNAIGIESVNSDALTTVKGNLTLKVEGKENESYALLAKDSGKIDILGKDKLVQITGDIAADTNGKISANLSTSDSFITGTITDNSQDTANKGTVNIGIDNGAKWNNTGNSSVTELTLNNGVINNNSIDNNISVETLKGNGGAVNMAAAIDEATGKATSGKVTINNIEKENVKLDVNFKNSGTVEADGDKAQEYFEELAKNIETTDTDSKITGTAALDEGFVSGGYEADITINKDGSKVENVTYTGLNSMIEGMRDLATINLLTWRQEMNSLNKRMGELRNSTGEHGVWSRVYTGKIENGSKYDNDYQTYQVGYDKKYTVDNGVMFVGGLVSYTDGETNYALGHGENYSVGAGIYATWLNNDGQFADVVLKQSRLHNKFDVRSKDLDKSQSGDYNNWGTSLSGQYGKRFDLNDKFFVEPSVELTLGRVDDTTYTTSAGVDVHQDTMYSLVGNVGTSVGYKFSDKGNIYARAALVKEFQGDIDTEYKKDGALERTSEDLGDTWAEFGVGVNYRFVENMNVYVDIQKTGEATVDNKWQANLGFRYEF